MSAPSCNGSEQRSGTQLKDDAGGEVMNKAGKVGLWAMFLSLIAGAVAVFAVGPRKIQQKINDLRGKSEMKELVGEGP